MRKSDISAVILCFGLLLVLGITPGEGVPRIDPNRPWVRPESKWVRSGKKEIPCMLLKQFGLGKSGRCKPSPFRPFSSKNDLLRDTDMSEVKEGMEGRKLDASRPNLRPETKMDQRWRDKSVFCKRLRLRGLDGGKRCRPGPMKNDIMRVTNLDESNDLDGRSGLDARKFDPSRPRLRPENNLDQGKKPGSLKPLKPWKPARPPWMKRKTKRPSAYDDDYLY